MRAFAGSLATRSSSFAGLMSMARRLNSQPRPRTCPFDNSAIGSMRGKQIFIGGLDCRSITSAARHLRRTMGSHNISITVSTLEDSSKSATSNRFGRRGTNVFCRIAMFSAPARIAVRQTHAASSVRPAADRTAIRDLVAFPWEDQLHVYTKQIRDIIPVFELLSDLGYRPASDIWSHKWVLDVQDFAWNIFIPLLC